MRKKNVEKINGGGGGAHLKLLVAHLLIVLETESWNKLNA